MQYFFEKTHFRLVSREAKNKVSTLRARSLNAVFSSLTHQFPSLLCFPVASVPSINSGSTQSACSHLFSPVVSVPSTKQPQPAWDHPHPHPYPKVQGPPRGGGVGRRLPRLLRQGAAGAAGLRLLQPGRGSQHRRLRHRGSDARGGSGARWLGEVGAVASVRKAEESNGRVLRVVGGTECCFLASIEAGR